MIVGVTGTLGAGKGTVVEFLKEKGFRHYSVRDFLVREIEKRGLPANIDSMMQVANDLRAKNSPSFIVEELYREAKEEGCDVIIESLRAPGEVDALKEKGDFFLIAVDAPIEERYKRIYERKSETDSLSFEEFKAKEDRQMISEDPNEQNLSKVISMADFKLDNSGTIQELNEQVSDVVWKIKQNN